MTIAEQLLHWLKSHPASYLEEQIGDATRLLVHKTLDGTVLQQLPMSVDVISTLIEMNWEGVIERHAAPSLDGLHTYNLPGGSDG